MIITTKRKNGSRRVQLDFRKMDPVTKKLVFVAGRTKGSFKDEVDINTIVARGIKSGLISHVNENAGSYGDFSGFTDYHQAMNKVTAAQESFDRLPANIRSRFQNDAGEFIEFLSDPKGNMEEMIELGLAKRANVDPTTKVSAAKKDPVPPAPQPAPAVPAVVPPTE